MTPARIPPALRLLPLLLLGVGLAHSPALWCRAVSFDDHQYLLDNPLVQRPGLASAWRFVAEVLEPSTVAGYYQPLSMISLMVDVALGGGAENFVPFHATSLALHLLNTALVVFLLRRLFQDTAAAMVVGLLFGLHPLTVEPIPWVGERKTLLAAAFALGSLLCYVRHARRPADGAEAGRRDYWLSLLLGVLAMMSKPTTTPLPLVLVLLDAWPLGRSVRRNLLEKLPFFVAAGAFAVITVVSQGRTSVATMPGEYGPGRIPLVICHNIIFYLWKAAWPVNLSSHYAFPDPLSLADGHVRAGVIGTCLLVPALLASLRRTRALAVGWLVFLVFLLPTLQIIAFSDVIASDKYVYLPSIGLLMVLAWLIRGGTSRGRRIVVGLALAAALLEARATWRCYDVWKDSETHYRHMLALTPRSAALHNNLAVELLGMGRFDDAIAHYRQALEYQPGTDETWTNIGIALVRQGRSDEALRLYEDVLRRIPRSYSIHCNLGALLAERGRLEEAMEHYRFAIARKPLRPEPHNNLANAYLALGRVDEAIAEYRTALDLRHNLPETHNNLAAALLEKDQVAEAETHLRQAVRYRADYPDAHRNLAVVLARQGRLADALHHCETALSQEPPRAETHVLHAQLLLDVGRREEAAAALREALRLEPHNEAAAAMLSSLPTTGRAP